MTVRSSSSEEADQTRKKSWTMHPWKEMVFSSVARPRSTLGSTEEMQIMSMVARLQRKKYIGLWRPVLELTKTMIRVFPVIATVYRARKQPSRNSCNLACSENPCRMNSVTIVWLGLAMRRKKPWSHSWV
jgi:hypothetical protein